MSYWNSHPEVYDEIVIRSLPKAWRVRVESGETHLDDVPEDVCLSASIRGVRDYWSTRTDEPTD